MISVNHCSLTIDQVLVQQGKKKNLKMDTIITSVTSLFAVDFLLKLIGTVVVLILALKITFYIYYARRRMPFIWYNNNCWAVVTGSTNGIGLEFARYLARKNYNLMLISRCDVKLKQTMMRILNEVDHQIQIKTLAVDFTDVNIYEQVKQFLQTDLNDIFILVNNVGIAPSMLQRFIDVSDTDLNQKIINVNVVGITKMTELILPSMLSRKRGLIINLSSMSSMFPVANMTTYSSTKVN